MTTARITLAITLLCGALAAAEKSDAKPEASEAPKAEPKKKTEPEIKLPKENQILGAALTNMSRLKGFHAEAVIAGTGGKATMSADLGEGSVSIIGKDPKGNVKHRIAVAGKFYLSADGGKTWKTGDEADKENTILFSNLITSPVAPRDELVQKSEWTSKEEIIEGEELLHLNKAAKGKEAGADYWVAHEESFKKDLEHPFFIRKAVVVIAADDGDFPLTITYTKLSTPPVVKVPATK